MEPFIIFSLPRSKTAWLSEFLTVDGIKCSHDLSISCNTIANFKDAIKLGGTIETGLAHGWPFVIKAFPGIKICIIQRPIEEVFKSLNSFPGWEMSMNDLRASLDRMDEISCLKNVISVTFEELKGEEGCKKVWEHCLGKSWDISRWKAFKDRNIQIDMADRIKIINERTQKISSFHNQIIARSYETTVQVEDLEVFLGECGPLLEQHALEAGNVYGYSMDVNVDMARALYKAGSLLLITARCAGTLVGYAIYMISPSLFNKHLILAQEMPFFVLEEYRLGLWSKIYSLAKKTLKASGVGGIILKSGIRASGERMETIFKRQGATYEGQMYFDPLEA